MTALSLIFCASAVAQDQNAFLETTPPAFQQALDKFPISFNSEDWKLINQKAEICLENRDYSTAADYALKARMLAEKLQDNLLIARSYHQQGRIQTYLLNYGKAKDCFGQAALFYAKTEKNPENKLEVGFLLKDLAFIYSNPAFINNRQNINAALFYLSQAYRVASSGSSPQSKILRIQTSLQIADCFAIKGNFLAQIVWLENLLTELSKVPAPNSPYLFDAHFGLQSAYRSLGSYEDAFRNIEKIESWLRRNPDQYKKLQYLRHISDFYTQIDFPKHRDNSLNEGIALSTKLNRSEILGDFYSAKMLKFLEDGKFKESNEYLALLEDLSKKENLSVNVLDIYVAKAVLAGYGNDPGRSEEYFKLTEKALEDAGGEWTNTLFLLIWKSRIALHQRDYEKLKKISETYLNAATAANSKDSLPLIYINLAKSYAGLGDVNAARKYNRHAVDLIESKRQANSAQISTGVIKGLYEAYEQLISYDLTGNKPEDAFQASERLKARWLGDKISNNPLTRKTLIDEKIKPEILNASLALLEKPDDHEMAAKLSELEKAALFNKAPNAENSLLKANTNVLTQLNTSPVNARAAVVSYAFTDERRLIAFVWQKDKPFKAVRLNLSLDEADQISRETSDKIKNLIFFKQDGKNVYDKLIEPLELASEIKHLIIVPDKSLWKIPFQALSADGKTYLIEDKMISYAPSVSVLVAQLNNAQPTRRTFQVFANSLYKNFYLKYADSEARGLARMFGVKPKLNAVISDFIKNADKSDIMHFSMHGEVERDAPFNSFLAFKPTAHDNGRLSVEELLKMKFKKGNLVFLASCDTNNIFNGEGLVSLAWGMFGAGASTVISAQWEANDQSTNIFTRSFYKNMQKGLTSAEALQQTSVEMIRGGNLSEPYFWAEYALNGDYR